MKLHVFPPSPRATKVTALANHLGLECELHVVDLFKGEQHQPGFAALNPNERMPVLEDDGFVLWESNAILHYLASKKPGSGLWPSDAKGQADVLRWHSWEAAHWFPACAILAFEHLIKKITGQGEPNPQEVARGEEQFHRHAKVLNAHLRGRKWLVGNDAHDRGLRGRRGDGGGGAGAVPGRGVYGDRAVVRRALLASGMEEGARAAAGVTA